MSENAVSWGVTAPSPNVLAQWASASAFGQQGSRLGDWTSGQAFSAYISPVHVGHRHYESVTLHTGSEAN
jgi:hypothetical protein